MTWSYENMKQAIEATRTGLMGLTIASRIFHVPRSTLHRRKLKNTSAAEAAIPRYSSKRPKVKKANHSWAEENYNKMYNAIEAVNIHGMTAYKASQKYDIPRSSLIRHLKKVAAMAQTDDLDKNLSQNTEQPVMKEIPPYKKYLNWKYEDMRRAISNVRNKFSSYRDAEHKYNVPKTTLVRRNKLKTTPDNAAVVYLKRKQKNRSVYDPPHENDIYSTKNGFLVDAEDCIKIYVDGILNQNRTGIGVWFNHNHPLNISILADEKASTYVHSGILAIKKAVEHSLAAGLRRINISTDCLFLIKAFNGGWIDRWRGNGWVTTVGDSIKNQPLLKELDDSLNHLEIVKWSHYPRRVSSRGMEGADALARLSANMWPKSKNKQLVLIGNDDSSTA